MILVPETTDRECIKTNALSSIGFLAFVTSIINAVMQVGWLDSAAVPIGLFKAPI